MTATPETTTAILDRLAMVPERIARAITGWTPADLRAPLTAGGWSAADVLAHLRASDEIQAWRLHALLVRDELPLPGFDERRWAEAAGYASNKFVSSLIIYRLRRQDLVATLRRATLTDWQRHGIHEEYGRCTLLALAIRLVEHEEEHCINLEAHARD